MKIRCLGMVLAVSYLPMAFSQSPLDTCMADRKQCQSVMQYYQRRAKVGDAAAQVNLAYLYLNIQKDEEKSLYWYRQAARSHQPAAYASLGVFYNEGRVVPKDMALANRYYHMGALGGDANAMGNYGVSLIRGEGIAQNIQQGAYWLTQSAHRGKAWAQYDLGLYYTRGLYLPQDIGKGLSYLERAAKAGFVKAALELGYLYQIGMGEKLPPNRALAEKWLEVAVHLGSLEAKHALNLLQQGAGAS